MSHGLTVMAPSGFLSRLTKCAQSQDLRLESLDVRKATLATLLARAAPGLRLNEHMEEDGPLVFHHACKLGLEGIVSKRKDSRYRSIDR
jgi:bifunctional non-homologous end joining protein LigD